MADNKVAIITAGGSGMGDGAAKAHAKKGYKVAIPSSSGNSQSFSQFSPQRRFHS